MTFIDLAGVDTIDNLYVVVVVYNHFTNSNETTMIKVTNNEVPTLTTIFPAAAWPEREAWEMYGIVFSNAHMQRLLTDYSDDKFPMRKTFAVAEAFDTLFYPLTSAIKPVAPFKTRQTLNLF
jgi:NADH-quinone oxidoreductase subunit C